MSLRQFARSNILLYSIWYNLGRTRSKVRLPQKGDDFFFTGYPRSGNTYLANLLWTVGNLKFASHLHTVAAIKIAIKRNLKIVVTIRNPFDAVSSSFFMKYGGNTAAVEKNAVTKLIDDYIFYHFYVWNNKADFFIIKFPECIEDLEGLVHEIMSYADMTETNLDKQAIKKFEENMQNAEANKTLASGSLPNSGRDSFKNVIGPLVVNNRNYAEACRLFDQITDA